MNREPSFARVIKNARKDKALSQKALAKKIGVDFTYLSKLENNRSNYSPREEVIRGLAKHLDLDEEELIFLAGRIPECDSKFLKKNYQGMAVLFRRMRENPSFAQEVFSQAAQNHSSVNKQ